ncbi:hypothetical protein BJ138DRAFT_1014302 [Hygrophoropsis aurantiaca]|uniref:Uncharacterized protein n=1 Tax=Hygrophoropsis aurantiaca TaxID=72124 RepID=A0ACB8A2Z5_9AGAM|nr:hypothetical protein BJ138DRAFT_1014302 [Hygrophoropsis aurantiaca]
MSGSKLPTIAPNPERWEPSKDPSEIAIPGLDTSASVNDQVDQIEQLITIKLQNIDANFSKIQHLLSTKLLPAVKRYAVGTEPVREAAKFWTSFYEQAAQVHIPTYADYSSVQEQQSDSVHDDETASQPDSTPTHTRSYDPNTTPSDHSFMPGHGAISSTPATVSRHRSMHPHDSFATANSDEQPSWTASMESPLVRLDRELQNFTKDDEYSHGPSISIGQSIAETSAAPTEDFEEENTIHYTDKGKSRDLSKPLLQSVLKQNLHYDKGSSSTVPTPRAASHHVSPLKLKPKTPIPKHLQTYLAPADYSDPNLPSPRRHRYERSPRKQDSQSTIDLPSLTAIHKPSSNEFNDSFDDSMDLMTGLSPPRTTQFVRAPRSSIGLGLLPKLGRTPGKEAANRIKLDLLGDAQSKVATGSKAGEYASMMPSFADKYGTDNTTSTIPTPPSLSRYNRHAYPSGLDSIDTDTTLESMLRRVGLNMPPVPRSASQSITSGVGRASSTSDDYRLEPSVSPSANLQTPDQQQPDVFHLQDDEEPFDDVVMQGDNHSGSDSDSDSLNDEEERHAGQPSTAFLMASQRQHGSDDSFGSSNHSSDSLGAEEHDGESAPIHPFARPVSGEEDEFDDSFDDDVFEGHVQEEETVFGIPPSQRSQLTSGIRAHQLHLLGEDLLQDTIGIGTQLAKAGRVEESPTPFGGPRS